MKQFLNQPHAKEIIDKQYIEDSANNLGPNNSNRLLNDEDFHEDINEITVDPGPRSVMNFDVTLQPNKQYWSQSFSCHGIKW